VEWTVDGQHFALTVRHADHIGLWVGSVEGRVTRIENVALNPLMGTAVTWLPDQKHLLVRRIPPAWTGSQAAGHTGGSEDPRRSGGLGPLHLRGAQPACHSSRRCPLRVLHDLRAGDHRPGDT